MAFIQTIWFSTERFEEMRTMIQEFGEADRQAGRESPGLRGIKVLKDRDHDGAYLVIAEFDSYEKAMANSARPETDAMAKRMAEMSAGAPAFANFDVVYEETP